MQSSLIQQGLDLLVYGMGTVFVFLTLLVVTVCVMSALIQRYFAEVEEPQPQRAVAAASQGPTPVKPQVLLAIQEAIYQHRARK